MKPEKYPLRHYSIYTNILLKVTIIYAIVKLLAFYHRHLNLYWIKDALITWVRGIMAYKLLLDPQLASLSIFSIQKCTSLICGLKKIVSDCLV